MKILITGFVIFLMWCFISAWLYNDKILPAIRKPVTEQTIPESQTNEADSIRRLKASMPPNLQIFFDFNDSKFNPKPGIDSCIDEYKAWLDKYAGSKVTVTGNTDLVGTIGFNKALGLKRARAVGKYLEARGIKSERIITQSLGKDSPVSDYLTAEGRAKNRRTEISIKMQ
jgi:outer membrane protein OmpA-like peptidoglycan-associated protein